MDTEGQKSVKGVEYWISLAEHWQKVAYDWKELFYDQKALLEEYKNIISPFGFAEDEKEFLKSFAKSDENPQNCDEKCDDSPKIGKTLDDFIKGFKKNKAG